MRRASIQNWGCACLMALTLSACQVAPPTDSPANTPAAIIEFDSYEEIRQRYNQRTSVIDQIYAVTNVKIEMTNHEGKQKTYRGDGKLYFRKPHDLALNIGKDLVQDTIMWIGSNDRQFWVFDMAPPEDSPTTAYLGENHLTYSTTLNQMPLPITANRLIDILAVSDLPVTPPVLISQANNADGSPRLILLFDLPSGDPTKILTQTYFLDPQSLEPRSIEFAENETVVLRATLSRYEPMALKDTLFTRYPPVPSRILLEAPGKQSSIQIDLVSPSDGKGFGKEKFLAPFFDFQQLSDYLQPDDTIPLRPTTPFPSLPPPFLPLPPLAPPSP